MVYQLKVQLLNVKKPPVWRRVLVPADITFAQLHEVIQEAMGWENMHLYQFGYAAYDSSLCIGDLSRDAFGMMTHDVDETIVSDFFNSAHPKMKYTYDFGDDWIHDVILEKEIDDADVKTPLPYCSAAKGACPPEDCGGPWGYAGLKEDAVNDENSETLEWFDIDPENFDFSFVDIDFINEKLKDIKLNVIPKTVKPVDPAKLAIRVELINNLIDGFLKGRLEDKDAERLEMIHFTVDMMSKGIYDLTRGKAEIWAAALIIVGLDGLQPEIDYQIVLDHFGVKEAGVRSRITNIHNQLERNMADLLSKINLPQIIAEFEQLISGMLKKGHSIDEAITAAIKTHMAKQK